ncbi:MAG: TonB-dependent receptor plug domain-containing protein, partial [Vicinamibacterales bacterium]|nr:TonB-dependent receptor plug domain-containing protein [Vicinamibacterales bacterium]
MTKPIVRSGALLAGAIAAAASSVTLLVPRPGHAQVDEIVVTTRKREENLQDVPIAIEAFSNETLQQKDIDNIADLTNISSSLVFDEGATLSDTRVVVRGLSPTRGRQNVAVLVDGIDLSTEAISNSGGGVLLNNRLVDVQRIEVVKGPQLALYGRSAFAGALQYVTKDPSEQFEADVLADGNEYDQYSLQGGISGPIFGEKLGYRLNGAWWDEDGFYKNSLTGQRLRDDEGFGLALTLKSKLTETLTLKFRTEYTDQQIGPSATVFLPPVELHRPGHRRPVPADLPLLREARLVHLRPRRARQRQLAARRAQRPAVCARLHAPGPPGRRLPERALCEPVLRDRRGRNHRQDAEGQRVGHRPRPRPGDGRRLPRRRPPAAAVLAGGGLGHRQGDHHLPHRLAPGGCRGAARHRAV